MYLISGNITGNVTGNLLVITGNGNIRNITSNFRTLVLTLSRGQKIGPLFTEITSFKVHVVSRSESQTYIYQNYASKSRTTMLELLPFG